MPGRVVFQSLSFTSVVALVAGLLFASAAFAQGPPPEPQLWSAVSTLDILAAARTCAADPICTSYDPPAGLQVDPATGQPLLSVHAKGAMDVGPLLDWAAAHPEVVLVEKLVHVFDMTGFEVDVSMDLLDAEAWTSLRDALELMASTAYVSLHGIPVQAEGIHPDLAAAHGAIQACGGDPVCLQDLHELWPWLDAELAIGALQIEVPHNGDPGQHDSIAAELESLTWTEPPWIFAIEPVAGGEHVTRAVGRMPSTQLDGLTAWLAGQPWSARSRPMVEDELSEVRLRLETADAAADVFACDGDMGCHYDASTLHQAVVSPGGRLGVLLHGEDPDIEGLNGLEYPGWSMAPAGYVHDGEAGLLEHQALRELGLGRWDLGEALSVGLDRNPELVGLSWEDWTLAWGPDDEPWTWEYAIPMPGQVLAVDANGFEYQYATIQGAIDASGDGWSVWLGEGVYDELIQVSGFTGLTIAAGGAAELLGAQVDSSTGVLLRRLEINATGTAQPGIELTGSSEVEVERCEVHGTDDQEPGLLVEPGSLVALADSRLHHNGGYGLILPADETRVQLVADTVVDANAAGGVLLKQGARAQLTGSRIFVNGGYGLELEPDGQPLEPERVELFDNAIAMNGGEKVQGESSSDLGWYAGLVDELDEDNSTTRGEEHPVLREIARPDLVWWALPDDEELAGLLDGMSSEAVQAVTEGRDAIAAARSAHAQQEEEHHPVLFDMEFDQQSWEPVDTTDCYSPFYSQPGFEVDYIADPVASVPLVPPPTPPVVRNDIHDSLDWAANMGDRTGDGTILICVQPGVYPGGFVIDEANFLSHGSPPLRLFGAAGPEATSVQGWKAGPQDHAVEIRGEVGERWPVLVGGLTVGGYGIPFLQFLPPTARAAIRAHGSLDLVLNRVYVEDNHAHDEGGGMRIDDGNAAVALRNGRFNDNTADMVGGGVYFTASKGSLEVTNCDLLRNEARDYLDLGEPAQGMLGGAVADLSPDSMVTLELSVLTRNATGTSAGPVDVGGAVYSQASPLLLDTGWLAMNDSGYGGAVALGWDHAHEQSLISSSEFLLNTATEDGGALLAMGPEVTGIEVVRFVGNSAHRGGAAFGTRLDADSGHFHHNGQSWEVGGPTTVADEGGGVYLFGEATDPGSAFAHSLFHDNRATDSGGAVYLAGAGGGLPGATVDFLECDFFDNVADWAGGGLFTRSSHVTLSGLTIPSRFHGNIATEGGGVAVFAGTLDVYSGEFVGNLAAEAGGAIAAVHEDPNAPSASAVSVGVHGGWLRNNQATGALGRGGAIFCGNPSTIDPIALAVDQGVVLSNNQASHSGGGIALELGWEAIIDEATLEDNVALFGGGVLAVESGGIATLEVIDSDFLHNQANTVGGSTGGGGLYVSSDVDLVVWASDPDWPVLFEGNTSGSRGGGLYSGGAESVSLADVEFRWNEAVAGGGGGWIGNGPSFTHVGGGYYSNNPAITSTDGGGLDLLAVDSTYLAELEFFDNEGAEGSALYAHGAGVGSVVVENSLIGHNKSTATTVDMVSLDAVVLSHVTITGNRSAGSIALRLWSVASYLLEGSVVAFNEGGVQAQITTGSSGAMDDMLFYSDTTIAPLSLGGSCAPCDYQIWEPAPGAQLFERNPGPPVFLPYDPLANYWQPPTADYDLHPFSGVPASPLLNDPLDPYDDIGAFGGPQGPLWCPTVNPPPGC